MMTASWDYVRWYWGIDSKIPFVGEGNQIASLISIGRTDDERIDRHH